MNGSQVVPSKKLTLQQLSQHSGQDPSVPIYLAIKGAIFDVSSGTASTDMYRADKE